MALHYLEATSRGVEDAGSVDVSCLKTQLL